MIASTPTPSRQPPPILRPRVTRPRRGRRSTAFLVGVGLLALVAGCTPQASAGSSPSGDSGGLQVVVLASATSTEPAPTLSARARGALQRAAGNDDASAVVATTDGDPAPALPLTPRRANGQVEHGLHRDTLIAQNLDEVDRVLDRTAAQTSGLDMIEGLAQATRGRQSGTLIVVSNGLSTRGALDLRTIGWNFEPDEIVDLLREQGLLPGLRGWNLLFTNLGDTSGPSQPTLPAPTRQRLVELWLAICRGAGASSCEADTASRPAGRPASAVPTPIVAVPTITSVRTPNGQTTTTVPDALLGFDGDSAEISSTADRELRALAADIRARSTAGPITVTGWTADPPGAIPADCVDLSQRRAEATSQRLALLGIDDPITARGGGIAPGPSSVQRGHYDPARASAMRFVSVTY